MLLTQAQPCNIRPRLCRGTQLFGLWELGDVTIQLENGLSMTKVPTICHVQDQDTRFLVAPNLSRTRGLVWAPRNDDIGGALRAGIAIR